MEFDGYLGYVNPKDAEPKTLIGDHEFHHEEPDMVNHPPHYQSKSGLEVADVIEAFTEDLVGYEATWTGNVIKYICRWKHKNGDEDLRKAMWCIQRILDKHKEERNEN